MLARSQIYLLVALVVALIVSAFSRPFQLGALIQYSGGFNPYYLDIAVTCGINITLAVSLNLINGFTGQFSLGHAGFMAIGAYTAAMITTTLGQKLLPLVGGQTWIFFPLALYAGGLSASLAGLLVGVPSLRLKGDYLAIVTLGFGEIIRVLLQNLDVVGGARGLIGIPDYSTLFWTFGLAAITIYTVWALVNSTYGRGFLAVNDDEIAAEAMGINTTRYKITAFVIGAFFAGLAGGIYAHFKQYIAPQGFGFDKSIEIVVMVILGGMGNNVGVIIAAILLTILTETLRKFGDYRMIVYSLLIIVLMIARPQGLFTWRGWKRKAV
jgi:branched-chain amino acid transport system permease protein